MSKCQQITCRLVVEILHSSYAGRVYYYHYLENVSSVLHILDLFCVKQLPNVGYAESNHGYKMLIPFYNFIILFHNICDISNSYLYLLLE